MLQMIPGMAGMLPADAMYEGEKKLYIYQQMIDAMEPEERHATPITCLLIRQRQWGCGTHVLSTCARPILN